jgi:hypothetical protein
MNNFTYKSCGQAEDGQAIIDLLFAVKDELYLPDRGVIQAITAKCFANGGVFGAYHGEQLCGMMGYFYGEPDQGFANKEVAFLYVAGILEPYRLTRMFWHGLLFALRHFQQAGVQEIRLQAEAANPYTNRLYGRFAQPLARGKSLRGKDVITYSGRIENALAYLSRGQRADCRAPETIPQRACA